MEKVNSNPNGIRRKLTLSNLDTGKPKIGDMAGPKISLFSGSMVQHASSSQKEPIGMAGAVVKDSALNADKQQLTQVPTQEEQLLTTLDKMEQAPDKISLPPMLNYEQICTAVTRDFFLVTDENGVLPFYFYRSSGENSGREGMLYPSGIRVQPGVAKEIHAKTIHESLDRNNKVLKPNEKDDFILDDIDEAVPISPRITEILNQPIFFKSDSADSVLNDFGDVLKLFSHRFGEEAAMVIVNTDFKEAFKLETFPISRDDVEQKMETFYRLNNAISARASYNFSLLPGNDCSFWQTTNHQHLGKRLNHSFKFQ